MEGPVARLLELDKLVGQQVLYMPSRNRQWHMYACSDRDARAPALKRLFLRGQVRRGRRAFWPGGCVCVCVRVCVCVLGGQQGTDRGTQRVHMDACRQGNLRGAHPAVFTPRPPPTHKTHTHTRTHTQVRQLGHPALLAAQYSGNTSAVAAAAVNELEEALVNCLEELTRPAPDHGAAGKADWVHLFFRWPAWRGGPACCASGDGGAPAR